MKKIWVALLPVVMLACFWAEDSWADRPLIFRVQQSLMIDRVDRTAYRLQDSVAQLAHPGDRLDQLGAGVQTSKGTIVLRLDTQAGQLKLAPHSRLRVTQITPHPDGGQWFYLTIEQGRVQIIPAPLRLPRSMVPVRSLNGVRAMGVGWDHARSGVGASLRFAG